MYQSRIFKTNPYLIDYNIYGSKIPYKNKINLPYYIDSSVLSNVPTVINFDNSHYEINLVISLSRFLLPKCHNFDINPVITEFKIHIKNIDKL